MAQKIQTLFADDIDGGEAEGTVRFGLDGVGYEIDLSVAHSEDLHKALAPYIAHSRKTGGSRRAVRGRSGNGSAVDTHKVREWARGQLSGIPEEPTVQYRLTDAGGRRGEYSSAVRNSRRSLGRPVGASRDVQDGGQHSALHRSGQCKP